MSRKTAWLVAAGVAAVAIGAAAVGGVALLVRGGGRTGDVFAGGGYLALELDGALPEEPASAWSGFLESRPPSVRGLVEAVDRAARDRRVKGLVLRLGSLDIGWARAQELHDALQRFRGTGKPSWAHLESPGNLEYFLATGCARIAASPTALLDVSGLAAEVTFYKGTLDKLGVEAQFEGVGRYKTAPNQLTEKGFTPPHREQMEALVEGLFGQYLDAVANGRKLPPATVKALIDRGPFLAEEAKQAGLVDELLYLDEIESKLAAGQRLLPAAYVKAARGMGFDNRPKLGLVYAVGDLVPGESQESPFGGLYAGADTIVRGLREAREDDSVRAIVLRVDSPGGSGTASDAVWREVQLARRAKPVIASMGDYAASGGYYVAMGADLIVAQPGTITGSIGVFSGKLSLRGLYQKLGMSQETVKRGRHAALFSGSGPWSDEERAKVRAMNEAFYATFVSKAAEGRKKTTGEIEAVAEGRVWTGHAAAVAGLVDLLGGLDEAVRVARERARIAPGQEVRLVVLPARKGFIETLMERQDEDVSVRSLGREAISLLRWGTAFSDRGPIARLPFELAIR